MDSICLIQRLAGALVLLKSFLFGMIDHSRLAEFDELSGLAKRSLEAGEDQSWRQHYVEPWFYFEHDRQAKPLQGWKLHISATPTSAPAVLAAVFPALLSERCAFKFVATVRLLRFMSSGHSARASSGKFFTVYPSDDRQAVRLAEILHLATRGLMGPHILSDKAYRPGSLVHYRFGGFSPAVIYGADGRQIPIIRDPEGRPIADRREAWFEPPDWVTDPFVSAEERSEETTASGERLLAGRYRVEGAFRHANKGGVYRAVDESTGKHVVLKEARPHVGVDEFDRDVIDLLRIEYANLETLSELGVAPHPLDLFEEGGHLFMAMELVEGRSLRQLVIHHRNEQAAPFPPAKVRLLILAAAEILETCHEAGIVIRDFNPNNLILRPEGKLLLIDPEMACREGEERPVGIGGGTPGYASPEQLAGGAPCRADDCYSLGTTAFFLLTALDPYLILEDPPGRPLLEPMADILAGMTGSGLVSPDARELISNTLHPEPSKRWTPRHVAEYCVRMADPNQEAATSVPGPQLPSAAELRGLACGLVEYVLENLDTERPRPLESSCMGEQTDPCCVQCGVAGVGSFLVSMLDEVENPGRLIHSIGELARWTFRDLAIEGPARPPGLYFGTAGAAWFLLDAANALGDEEILEHACRNALALPSTPPLHDVTHGAAGIGMMFLHFHHRTGRGVFLSRALRMAQTLVERSVTVDGGLLWPVPQEAGEEMAGTAFYGFAHGTAGICYFLLSAHAATGESRFLDIAEAGGATLIATAREVGDGAFWDHGPTRSSNWPHWCNGSSGVGTTLLRFFHLTGRARYRELAEKAARAVMAKKWYSTSCQCHGLAGNGDFLLDLYHYLQDEQYLIMARELAEVLWIRRVHLRGRVLFPDATEAMVSPDFGIGAAGVGSFLFRLSRGGPRPYMVDEVLEGDHLPQARTAKLGARG